MANYKKMYFNLAAKVSDAIDLLIKAQQEGEETYINADDEANVNSDTHEEGSIHTG